MTDYCLWWDIFGRRNGKAKRTQKTKRLEGLEKQGPQWEVWGLPFKRLCLQTENSFSFRSLDSLVMHPPSNYEKLCWCLFFLSFLPPSLPTFFFSFTGKRILVVHIYCCLACASLPPSLHSLSFSSFPSPFLPSFLPSLFWTFNMRFTHVTNFKCTTQCCWL